MYLRPLTVPSMEKIFCEVLTKLGINPDAAELPAFVRPLLQYIPGVPRQLQLVFAAVAQSDDPHAFQKSKLLLGLRLHREHPERSAGSLMCITPLVLLCLLPKCVVSAPRPLPISARGLAKADADAHNILAWWACEARSAIQVAGGVRQPARVHE